MEVFVLKPLAVGKLNLFSGILNDALMHHVGLKGYISAKSTFAPAANRRQ